MIGYPYFEGQREALAEVKKTRLIVIVSQAFAGEALTKLAVESRAFFPGDVEVALKLHPGEYSGWEGVYPWLADSGVTIYADDRVPLMQLQAKAMVQIGCGSTALYEGLAFGCRTYCLDVPGVEVVQPLLDAGLAEILDTGAAGIDLSPVSVEDTSGFFASGWKTRLRETLQEIGLSGLMDAGIAESLGADS